MPAIYMSEDVRSLLKGKRIVLMGCSNVRAIYKDMVCLYQHNQFISNQKLKLKMEESSFGDILVCHGKKHNGRDYKEERLFKMDKTTIAFYFLTRIYNDYVKAILEGMVDELVPDVIMVGSCLWDITRWGPNGVEEYKTNLAVFFTELKRILPPTSLVIWLTAAPLAQDVRGGFLIPQLEFLKYSLRFHVLEANSFCRETADKFGIDVVDIHYHLRMLLEHRAKDGIHWLPLAVRLCTNLLLTHIALSWGSKMPEAGKFITGKERKVMLADKNGFDYTTDEDSKGECSSLPAELSFSTILGCDEEVRKEVIKNAIEVPPSERPKARRGNWRARRFSGLHPFHVSRQNEIWQGAWQPGFQHQGPGPWNNQGQPGPDSQSNGF
ncbi:PC-esterase domain-containing protein 1A-like [Dermacentor albipictus]|uniref:PC-esterase domain-containing protein 1A-like n=1 Tax=Dermacentor albipictus TaxID=60249 RepID=UPI0031FCAC62